MEIHRVVQTFCLGFQQHGVKGGVTGHVAQGGVEDVADVLDLVSRASAARDVLLTFAHFLCQLILESRDLRRKRK